MEILFILGALIIGIGVGITVFGRVPTPERPCTCQCQCAAPTIERDAGSWARDLFWILLVIVVIVVSVGLFVVFHSQQKAAIPSKGKGRKGVFGAPLQLRDKEL